MHAIKWNRFIFKPGKGSLELALETQIKIEILLFFAHLLQMLHAFHEELYQGTSKGAKVYAARLNSKQERMNIAIQWQNADSSSSKAVTDTSLMPRS